MPIAHGTFGRQMESLIQSGIVLQAFVPARLQRVGLDAADRLGVGHPIAIALQVVFPVGFAAIATRASARTGP
jgi:hypothetical protein